MSETTAATLEIGTAITPPESGTELGGEDYVSQLLGISKAEVQALANELDSALSPILSAHSNTVVVCGRLGGVEMTLGQAVNTIWPPSVTGAMLIEGLPSVLAEIQNMLANRVEETQETQEDESEEVEAAEKPEAEKESNDKTQTRQQENTKTEAQPQPKKDISQAKRSDHPVSMAKEPAKPVGFSPAKASEGGPIKPQQTLKQQVEAKLNLAEVPDTKTAAPGNRDTEAETSASGPGPKVVLPEAHPEPQPDLLVTSKIAQKHQAQDLFVPNIEITEFPSYVASPEDEGEILPDALPQSSFEDQAEAEPMLFKEEILFDRQADEDPPPSAQLDFYALPIVDAVEAVDISDIVERMDPAVYEQVAPVVADIEEIETALIQLAGQIEANQPETAEVTDEILDKIVEVPLKLNDQTGENIISQGQAQEELEELFTELFDVLAVDYTPELIESLAYLTITWRLADEIGTLRNEDKEEAEDVPQGTGTHEIIRKLLVGLSTIKRAMAQAGAIGKSALRLYVFSFAT